MTSIGMIGMTPGNGHPLSFSAIVNGFDPATFPRGEFEMIHNYLSARSPDEFGVGGAKVTHVWTQDPETTALISRACSIPNTVGDPVEMRGLVDALVIARDDPGSHVELARPFLEHGTPVFVDKPLTMQPDELGYFAGYLEQGLLMSSSGLRYATELDDVRAGTHELGEVLAIRGIVPNEWERYGAHILDAVQGACGLHFTGVRRLSARHECMLVETSEDVPVVVDALGMYKTPIAIDVLGTEQRLSRPLRDNFGAFRRLLGEFISMVHRHEPVVPAADTLRSVAVLIAGDLAPQDGGLKRLDEIIGR